MEWNWRYSFRCVFRTVWVHCGRQSSNGTDDGIKGPNENKNESRNSSLEPTTKTTSKVEREEVNFQNYYYFVKVVLSQQFFELFMCLVALRFRFIVRHIPIWQTNDFEMSFSRPHCRVSTRSHSHTIASETEIKYKIVLCATRVGEVCA